MKKQFAKILGLLCYLTILSLLFDFNWVLIFRLKPFLSVLLGMILLTASQYKKQYTKEDIIVCLRWNLLLASFLTTIVSILSSATSGGLTDMTGWRMAESLLPMLYGSLIYLILSIAFDDSEERKTDGQAVGFTEKAHDLTVTFIAEQVFRDFALTNRECHVALKLLHDMANKEIAATLYISEATVKKHIQNIYQKFGATDRNSFRDIYYKSAERKL